MHLKQSFKSLTPVGGNALPVSFALGAIDHPKFCIAFGYIIYNRRQSIASFGLAFAMLLFLKPTKFCIA